MVSKMTIQITWVFPSPLKPEGIPLVAHFQSENLKNFVHIRTRSCQQQPTPNSSPQRGNSRLSRITVCHTRACVMEEMYSDIWMRLPAYRGCHGRRDEEISPLEE